MFEPRIRENDSLESWGIQGAHLTWSIRKYPAWIHPNILYWVSFVDFPKTHTSANFIGQLLKVTICPLWWKRLKLETVFNITWWGWFSRVLKLSFIYFCGELIFLGFLKVSWVNIEIRLFLFLKCNIHIKLQEVELGTPRSAHMLIIGIYNYFRCSDIHWLEASPCYNYITFIQKKWKQTEHSVNFPTYVAVQLTNFTKLERKMLLGQLHGRTCTGPKALNPAVHLMQTFLISLTDLLEE